MAEVKIKADLEKTIELLAEKLGLAAEEIVPYYTKLMLINGIVWAVGGAIMAVLPWAVFWPITLPQGVEGIPNYSVLEPLVYASCGFKWIICIAFTWGGGYTIFNYIENLLAPKALAIQKLIGQIT